MIPGLVVAVALGLAFGGRRLLLVGLVGVLTVVFTLRIRSTEMSVLNTITTGLFVAAYYALAVVLGAGIGHWARRGVRGRESE